MRACASNSIRARCFRLRPVKPSSLKSTLQLAAYRLASALLCLVAGTAALAQPATSGGQTLYLPVYSHVRHGDVDSKGVTQQTLVSALVSVRNTDTAKSIRITSAVYYDSQGRRLREYLDKPLTLAPLAAYEIFVPRNDTAGGSGAGFIIVW